MVSTFARPVVDGRLWKQQIKKKEILNLHRSTTQQNQGVLLFNPRIAFSDQKEGKSDMR